MSGNLDQRVVESFGHEWSKFDQSGVPEKQLERIFGDYFEIFPWNELGADAEGFDLGCGTGRWARFVAPRVSRLHCIDPSAALEVARRNLAGLENVRFHNASVDAIPLSDGSQDFGYSLGVLHHIPDTLAGLKDCVRRLKPGAPMLLYLYYALENRPLWYRWMWRLTDIARRVIAHSPQWFKETSALLIAACAYWPLARLSRLLRSSDLPLSAYADRSFYVMRNDALDRFGTTIERRFSKAEMEKLMLDAGLERICFSDRVFWCAVGYRAIEAGTADPRR